MSIISYFPAANKLKRDLLKYGDAIAVKGLSHTSSSTTASHYSGNYLLSATSYTFALIKSNITAAYLPECTTIGSSTFRLASNLVYISLPKCTYISNNAFYGCNSLKSVCFPNCVTVRSGAFSCFSSASLTASRVVYLPELSIVDEEVFTRNNIIDLTIPKASLIGKSAFMECIFHFSSVVVEFPAVQSISSNAFYGAIFPENTNLRFDNCLNVQDNAFYGCSLPFVKLLKCISLGSGAFQQNETLTTVYLYSLQTIPIKAFYNTGLMGGSFPACTTISYGAFANTRFQMTDTGEPIFPLCTTLFGSITSSLATFCTSHLQTISFPKLTAINTGFVFAGCSNLMSVYLMNSVVCSLTTSSAFTYTPITNSNYTGTFGSIYVPASLLASYKAASNWKTISARLVGI